MRFYVPQFIDIEDKVFGPLSFRQFAYLVGGAGLSYLLFRFFYIFIAVPLIVCVVALTVALAFYRVNNKPFLHMIQAAFKYFSGTRLYIWKKEEKKITASRRSEPQDATENIGAYIPKLSDSKLKELSWSLGVKDSIYASRENHPRAEIPVATTPHELHSRNGGSLTDMENGLNDQATVEDSHDHTSERQDYRDSLHLKFN